MNIIVHTMEYGGDLIEDAISLKPYSDHYYTQYKQIYNECFSEMRRALKILPVHCCSSRKKLIQNQEDIFVLMEDQQLIASVAIFDNEINDLIVAKPYQGKGYGKLILKFAVRYMQERGRTPITLHVADWNKRAVALYLSNGFRIVNTETIKR